MTPESKFRILSLILAPFLFASATAITAPKAEKSTLSIHMEYLEEAELINKQALAPHNLTQVGVQREIPIQKIIKK